MRAPLQLVFVVVVFFTAINCQPAPKKEVVRAKEEERRAKEGSAKAEVELVGTLRVPRSSKSAYQLEIYPPSNQKTIEMLGDSLRGIPDKTPVRVLGVVRSQVVGPAKGDADQYPIQWGVWLRVSKVETFPSLEEAFREPRERHLRENGR
ncbi:MAG: hypothetical protein WCF18_06540 [Chthoniobacteraceae bacterium]